jgi:large subunit ribosomal protein L4
MLADVYTKEGVQAGQVELLDNVFGIEPNENAMHRAVVTYLAHQRQGNHKTKTRSEVRGGGRKPWRQKGRGTARAGSTRSPIWIGGGTIFGPKPHKYNLKLSKKLKSLAKRSALSARMSEDNIKIVEDFTLEEIKTKNFAEILKNLNLEYEKTLILIQDKDDVLYMSSRNIPYVNIYQADMVSAYHVLAHNKILIFKGAIEKIHNALNNSGE